MPDCPKMMHFTVSLWRFIGGQHKIIYGNRTLEDLYYNWTISNYSHYNSWTAIMKGCASSIYDFWFGLCPLINWSRFKKFHIVSNSCKQGHFKLACYPGEVWGHAQPAQLQNWTIQAILLGQHHKREGQDFLIAVRFLIYFMKFASCDTTILGKLYAMHQVFISFWRELDIFKLV